MRRRDADRFARKMVSIDRKMRDVCYRTWYKPEHHEILRLELEWQRAVDEFAAKHTQEDS